VYAKVAVHGRGATGSDIFTICIASVGFGGLVSFYLNFGLAQLMTSLPVWLISLGTFLGSLLFQFQEARRIELDETGIRVFAWLQTRHIEWSDFDGFPFPAKFGEIGLVPSARASKGWAGAYWITVEQAQAIHAYPACPSLRVPESIRSSLRIP
jgi:hypothetical protein